MKKVSLRIALSFFSAFAMIALCLLILSGCGPRRFIEIVSPADVSSFESGDSITFSMRLVKNILVGVPPSIMKGTIIQWTSDRDGDFWKEEVMQNVDSVVMSDGVTRQAVYQHEFSTSALSMGDHTITCRADETIDSVSRNIATAHIKIYIAPSQNNTTTTATATTTTNDGPAVYENAKRSGNVHSSEIWKGTIDVTGDVVINAPATITITPGTIVRFAAGRDDQAGGGTTPITDPYFPHDPATPPSVMSTIGVYGGTLYAIGTPDRRITFTSSNTATPVPGDWQSISYQKAGSTLLLQYTTIEYSYYGVQICDSADNSNVIIKNNIIKNIVACGICCGVNPLLPVAITIAENDISYCGHEGIDTHPNATAVIIENNLFHNIYNYVDGPSGSGVVVDGNNAVIRNNQFVSNRFGINIISEDSHPSIYGNTFADNYSDCFGFCPAALR